MKVTVTKAFVTYDGKKQIIGKKGEHVEVSPTCAKSLAAGGFIEKLEEAEVKTAMKEEKKAKKAAKVIDEN